MARGTGRSRRRGRTRSIFYSDQERLAAINVLHAYRFEWSGPGDWWEFVDEIAFALGLWREVRPSDRGRKRMTLPAYLDTHAAIVGASGAGKTVTAKGMVEQLLADHRQVVVIDPTGAWWGLQTNAGNTGPGFNIPIFGGLYATVPIGAADGDATAGAILDQRISAIVDLSEIHAAEDQREFMADFVQRLRRKSQANFHLVVDEADEFCPQTAPDKPGYRLIQDMIWLAKRGRLRGFVLTMITQRPADIQKAVLSQMQTLVAHQLIAPSDQRAIGAYLKDNADKATQVRVMQSLAQLARGERWIYSPALQLLEHGVSPPLTTFDSSSTPAPGEERAQPRSFTDIDADALRAALAAARPSPTPIDAREAFDAGTAAGERIIALEAEVERQAEEIAGMRDALLRADRVQRERTNMVGAIDAAIGDLQSLRRRLDRAADNQNSSQDDADPKPVRAQAKPVARTASRGTGGTENAGTAGETALTPGARKLMLALASVHPRALTLAQAAKLAGVSAASSQWRANATSLTTSRYVEEGRAPDTWTLADCAFGDIDVGQAMPIRPSDPLERWVSTFSPAIGAMLRAIAAAGEPLSKFEVAMAAGVSPTSSTLGTGLRELRVNGLIRETPEGWMPTDTVGGGA